MGRKVSFEVDAEVKDAQKALSDVDRAVLKLIQTEKALAANNEAKLKFDKMTASEKEAALAALKLSDAQDKAAQSTKQLSEAAAGLSLTDLKSGIDLAKGALESFTGVFKQAFEIGKEGGAVIQTAQSFNRLIEKLDLSTDLLNQLRTASAGTIDDLKLMSSTSTLLAGTSGALATSLGNATPQLLEIAKAANKLNPTLGDTAFMYESIALGIKRASPMILDNLGLTIKIGEANDEYAASLGKTAEQLTADEQKQALLNATLKAGKILIEQAGGAAGGATDSFARLETASKNAGDALKAELSPALANAAEALHLLLTWNQKMEGAVEGHKTAVKNIIQPYEKYDAEMRRSADAAGILYDEQGKVFRLIGTGAYTVREYTGAVITMNRAEYEAQQAKLALKKAFADVYQAGELDISQQDELAKKTYVSADAYRDMNNALQRSKDVLDQLNVNMGNYTAQLMFNKAAANLDAEAQVLLAQQMGLINQSTASAMGALAGLKKGFDDGKMSTEAYVQQVAALDRAVRSLPDTKNVTVNYLSNYQAFQEEEAGKFREVTFIPAPAAPKAPPPPKWGGGQADGGTYRVTTPTMFLAGEAGPEIAKFTPENKPSGGAGVIININGWQGDAMSLAAEIERRQKLQRLMQ